MRSAVAALLALGLAASAGAASFDVSVDPRFELLGVIEHLAGLDRADAQNAAYRESVDRRFAKFKDHPAVALYRNLGASESRVEAVATIPIYFSAPPELALQDKEADIHYLNGPNEREEMQRFIWELRDFARASDFMAFFRENAPLYRKAEDDARRDLGVVDPLAAIEGFLGVGLSGRSHYIVPLLARGTHAFIVPYPLPPARLGQKSFDTFTITGELRPRDYVWSEPLYVYIDPSFYYFEKLNIPDPAAFYGPEIARCRAVSPVCTKEFLVGAIIDRLKRRAGFPGSPAWAGEAPASLRPRYMKALSERLDEYERERTRYPTLWTFYPRLFSVFYELAHDGRPAPGPLSVPADSPIRAAADFFDPAIVGRLNR
jgi:hypothetical protein